MEVINKINTILKEMDLEAKSVYKINNQYIVSGCLIKDPTVPLDDCLFLYDDESKKIREYGLTENPKELTKALNNPIYYRGKD